MSQDTACHKTLGLQTLLVDLRSLVAPGKQGPADDGKRLGLSESALDVACITGGLKNQPRGGSLRGEGAGSSPDRRLADDGKRLELSEFALDVASR